jgi:hypothetical protein
MKEERRTMRYASTLACCALGIVCSTHALEGQSFSRYRNFDLGSNVAAVSTAAGIAPTEAKTLHQRPAVLQELEWRPSPWVAKSSARSSDPVVRVVFSFYNDQLFRLVVDYGRERTEGLTAKDLTEAISAVYGTPLPRTTRNSRVPAQVETESGSPLARWGDPEHAVVLYQTSSYSDSFRLIVTDVPRAELARKADAEALRLDDLEAPQREIARQNNEREAQRAAEVKARAANKGDFRP